MKKNKINDGYYVEALDRLFLVTDMMDRFLMDHPVIRQDEEIKKLVKFSIINLLEAYQKIGSSIYENEKKGIQKVVLRRRKNTKK